MRAFAQQAGPDPAHLRLSVDGSVVGEFDVLGTRGAPTTHGVTLELDAGEHTVDAAFTNDWFRPDAEDPALDFKALQGRRVGFSMDLQPRHHCRLHGSRAFDDTHGAALEAQHGQGGVEVVGLGADHVIW